MSCKAYNSESCRKHCKTQEEANNVGGQCCVYCFNGKNLYGCPDCNLEIYKEYKCEK